MPTSAIDPKVLELVNAGVGALAVVIFFLACFFAYPVIKQKNPDKGVIGLCKWMSGLSVVFLFAAIGFLLFKPTGKAMGVMVTVNPQSLVESNEFNQTAFLRRGEKEVLLQGTSRQSVEVRDRDQLDFHLDKLWESYRDMKLMGAQQQQNLAMMKKKEVIDVAE